MAHEIQIRVGSDGVYVTAVDGKRRADIARIPRTTGAGQTFTVDDLVGRRAHALKTTDDVKGDGKDDGGEGGIDATKRAVELAEGADPPIDLTAVTGTGPKGRIYADDVKDVIDARATAASEPTDDVEAEPTE